MLKELLFILGLTATASSVGVQRLFPELNTQYIYILKSNISSGTLVPGETASHWTLDGKLYIHVLNYTNVRCTLVDIKTSISNKNQHYHSELPEDASALNNPWDIVYQPTGTVYSIQVLPYEPVWSANIKRALSLSLQLQKPEGVSEISFNVNEPCLHGICNVEYTCVDGKTIRKTHDIPTLQPGYGRYLWSSVPNDTCSDGHNKPAFIGSAERVYHLANEKNLLDLDLKSYLTYHSHNYILAVTTELSLNLDQVIPLESYEDLDLTATHPSYYPHFYNEPSNGRNVTSQDALYNDTKQILLKISQGIDAENIVRNSSLIHSVDFLELHRLISRLDYQQLLNLYNELSVGTSYIIETARNIYLEVLPFGKTSYCALLVKYLVLEHKDDIEDATVVSLIRKVPFNVANYSQELIDNMESLTKLGPEYSRDIRYAGILSFATLAYHTYNSGACSSDYFENIVVKYFKMYIDCPQYIDRMIWLQGLSNLQIGSVFSYLAPKIMSKETNRHERFLGILATLPTAAVDPNVATVISWPLLTNEEEHIQLRIAALTQLLAADLTPGRVLAIHEYISNSNNQQLKRFWYTTVRSLEKSSYNCFQPMAKYLSYVSKLVSSPDSRYWGTGNFIVDSLDQNRNTAALMHLWSIGDPLTGLPEVVQFNVRVGQGRLVTSNFVIILKVVGASLNLYKRILKMGEDSTQISGLLKVLRDMDIKTIHPDKVHIELVAKYQDKTVFATHMNQTRFESLNIFELQRTLQDFLRFGSHINQQAVWYPVIIDTNLATELGTPVTLQTTFASFTSIRGNLTGPPSQNESRWNFDVHLRYQGTTVTSLSTAGPLLPSDHVVLIQKSMVAHLPLKFDISLIPETKLFKLKWPNPGTQNGGIAMHARAQVAMTSPTINDIYTVETGEKKYSSKSGIIFECDKPLTGDSVLDKVLNLNLNYDQMLTVKPPIIVLQSIFLLSEPPSGFCGVIFPPTSPRNVSDEHVLELEVKRRFLDYSMDENFKLEVGYDMVLRRMDGNMFLNVSGVTNLSISRENFNFHVLLSGVQEETGWSLGNFKLQLVAEDVRNVALDQGLSLYPSGYEGSVDLTFGYQISTKEDQATFPESGLALKLEYKGMPLENHTGKGLGSQLEFNITGDYSPSLTSSNTYNTMVPIDNGSNIHWEQIVKLFDKIPINIKSIIKTTGGEAILKMNDLPEFRLSENLNWILDNWNYMQIFKKFGLYRECRLQESTVHTLLGTVERQEYTESGESLVLADCSASPNFALLRNNNGGYKLYTADNYITIEPSLSANPTIRVNNQIIDYHKNFTYPDNDYLYKITNLGDGVKVHPKLGGIIIYYKTHETTILVPHIYLSVACGSCLSN